MGSVPSDDLNIRRRIVGALLGKGSFATESHGSCYMSAEMHTEALQDLPEAQTAHELLQAWHPSHRNLQDL